MAIPHRVQKRKFRERASKLSGKDKIRAIEQMMAEMAQYKSGSYADLRKEMREEIRKARITERTKARNMFDVRRDGDFQFAMVGPPSVGKSSIIKALTGAQVAIADYRFTTLAPFSASQTSSVSGCNWWTCRG